MPRQDNYGPFPTWDRSHCKQWSQPTRNVAMAHESQENDVMKVETGSPPRLRGTLSKVGGFQKDANQFERRNAQNSNIVCPYHTILVEAGLGKCPFGNVTVRVECALPEKGLRPRAISNIFCLGTRGRHDRSYSVSIRAI